MLFEVCVVVGIALLFDFTNGFHNAANAIATSVATKSISPRLAVIGAGILEAVGAFTSIKVAATIGGLVNTDELTGQALLTAVLGGLCAAIAWNLFTWWRGLPTSSSHSLVGGIAGSAMVIAGTTSIVEWGKIEDKVIKPSIYVPILGFVLAAILALCMAGAIGRWLDRFPKPLRGVLVFTGGFVALSHGKNDAQKTMGIITLALVAGGYHEGFDTVPTWVIACSATAIAIGVYSGGWRIVATLGNKLSELDLRAGIAAQASAGLLLWRAADFGFPISTTQVITGSILGSGSKVGWRKTRWGVAGQVGIAWIITMPSACAVGAAFGLIGRLPGGVYLLYVCVAAGLFGIWLMRKLMFGAWEDTEVDSMIAAERVGGLDNAEVIEHEVHPERFEEKTPAATR